MYHGFKGMFQLFLESKALKNVNDTQKKQQTLTLHISCRYASRTVKMRGRKWMCRLDLKHKWSYQLWKIFHNTLLWFQTGPYLANTNKACNTVHTYGTWSSSSIGSESAWIDSMAVEWATNLCRLMERDRVRLAPSAPSPPPSSPPPPPPPLPPPPPSPFNLLSFSCCRKQEYSWTNQANK